MFPVLNTVQGTTIAPQFRRVPSFPRGLSTCSITAFDIPKPVHSQHLTSMPPSSSLLASGSVRGQTQFNYLPSLTLLHSSRPTPPAPSPFLGSEPNHNIFRPRFVSLSPGPLQITDTHAGLLLLRHTKVVPVSIHQSSDLPYQTIEMNKRCLVTCPPTSLWSSITILPTLPLQRLSPEELPANRTNQFVSTKHLRPHHQQKEPEKQPNQRRLLDNALQRVLFPSSNLCRQQQSVTFFLIPNSHLLSSTYSHLS